ncbi:hypothetical protein LTR70_010778 [Exophiala xenobiotica]|nr:hypothetical protein LTR70_010778 [Exophiala xenobiotica]
MALSTWLLALLLCACRVYASFWRLPCSSRAGTGRLDPLMSPGVPSEHTHVVFGSRNFGLNTSYADLMAAVCTSCSVVQDKSAYWVPTLYFTPDNRTFSMVPQRGDMVVYYFMNRHANGTMATFPPDFRMLSGDSKRRTITIPVPDPPKSFWSEADITQDALRQKAIGFNCLGSDPPEGSLQRHSLPSKAFLDRSCSVGLRLELMFPSCWDGLYRDSSDHRSHVAFPSLVQDGACPDGYPWRLPTLLYEVSWQTTVFANRSGSFVLANGDPTGLGYHGDFMSGWDPALLQSAGEQCTDSSGDISACSLFDVESKPCQFALPAELRSEDYHGPRIGLPGIGLPYQH